MVHLDVYHERTHRSKIPISTEIAKKHPERVSDSTFRYADTQTLSFQSLTGDE